MVSCQKDGYSLDTAIAVYTFDSLDSFCLQDYKGM